jgi:P27 family predicted phage terminase small subunit
MTRGRKPDGADLQDAKGNPSRRSSRKAVAETPVRIGNVLPPKWLKKSRAAVEIWNDLAPRLQNINLLSELDARPLGRYCRYLVEWVVADQTVQKEGTWYDTLGTNEAPTKKRHPAWQAMQDLEKMLRELEEAFGMRPDARYKILRDQAAAGGQLPLFPGHAAPAQDLADAPAHSHDLVGAMDQFDSAPPVRPN